MRGEFRDEKFTHMPCPLPEVYGFNGERQEEGDANSETIVAYTGIPVCVICVGVSRETWMTV